MSQLNVNAIYDAAGGDSVDVFSENAAKAWVNLNMTSATVLADFGFDSITDNGAGDFTGNLTTAFASANYAVVASTASFHDSCYPDSTTACSINNYNSANTQADVANFSVTCYGDQ